MKKYKWEQKLFTSYYYNQETGQIVGEYSTASLGTNGTYYASVHGDSLGQYITDTFARKAVEAQIAKNDKDTEEIRNKMPKL